MKDIREENNRHQLAYYGGKEHARLAHAESRYVQAHIARMLEVAGVAPSSSILEIGSGTGKFTLPMSRMGYDITANDLSPKLLGQLSSASDAKIRTLCCDVHDITHHSDTKYDAVIGFFVLHHLIDFSHIFHALKQQLKPGGRIAFCEPVAVNPLYYLQILLTPGMRLAAEPSITKMRPDYLLPIMYDAGFTDAAAQPYGYFPPFVKNTRWGDWLEQRLEAMPFIPFPHAFQVFTASLKAL